MDAQLPLPLAVAIRMTGRDVKHTLDLPLANKTSDDGVRQLAMLEDRIVITKDKGFRESHILNDDPKRLVYITTGNIRNAVLLPLFIRNLPQIEEAFERGDLIVFSLDGIHVQK